MNRYLSYFFVLVLTGTAVIDSYAFHHPMILSGPVSSEGLTIASFVSILPDSTGTASVGDVLHSRSFLTEDVLKDDLDAGVVWWMKFSIINDSSYDKELYLNPDERKNFNYAAVYQYRKGILVDSALLGGYEKKEKLKSPYARFHYRFFVPKGERTDILLRLENTNHYPVGKDMHLNTAESQWNHHTLRSTFILLFFGALLVLAVYNLLLVLLFKKKIYLWYFLYLMSIIVFSLYQNDYLFFLLGDYPQLAPWLNVVSIDIALIIYCLFVRDFFDTRKNFPKVHVLIMWIIGVGILKLLVTTLLAATGMHFYLADLVVLIPFLPTLFLLIYCLYRFSSGNTRSQWFLVVGSLVLLVSAIFASTLALLMLSGMIDLRYGTISLIVEAGALVETICFSLALAKRTREMDTERRKAQEKIIIMQQENNLSLEKKVQKRTEELSATNEELRQQSEEINAINENLEKTVNTRTKQLRTAINILKQQNENLEQFSYIVSHNIRGPITRILGLINLFNLVPKSEYNEIADYLVSSVEDLSVLANDLSTILEIRNQKQLSLQKLDLLKIVNKVIGDLTVLHSEVDVNIDTHFPDISQVVSHKTYLMDTLHHLLSNAIKFRDPNRQLKILVSTGHYGDDEICISVQDNGLGLKLDNTDMYKIFGLYQRMHDHVEGKGLGLFLVKTKVEALGGRVTLESEVGKGSNFKVYLRKYG